MCFSIVTSNRKLRVLDCEVVGKLILPAASRPFKLRMCTSGTVTSPAEKSEVNGARLSSTERGLPAFGFRHRVPCVLIGRQILR